MRPIKLEFSAFITYANKTVIDFEKFGTSGLYLITGATGAGKTTIFDAITYALFGKASGAKRSDSMLRCKYASLDTPTYVELSFENSGKIYRVKRNPEYERSVKRGSGTTTENSSAVFYYPDGRVLTKIADVNDAIKEIIGIDYDRFSQISMLAQGEFTKVLLSKSEERQAIFRDLFGTARYSKLQEALAVKASNLAKDCNGLREKIKDSVKSIDCLEKSPLFVQVIKAKDKGMPMAEVKALIEKLLEYDTEEENACEKRKDEIEKELDSVKGKIKDAEKYAEDEANLNKTLVELKTLSDTVARCKANNKSAEAMKPEADNLLDRKSKIEARFLEYDQRDAKESEASDLRFKIVRIENELTEKREGKKQNALELDKLRIEFKSLENAGEAKQELLRVHETQNDRIDKLTSLSKQLCDYNELNANFDAAQKFYLAKSGVAERERNEHDRLNKAYLDAQAGVLASRLEEGKPCPVCGSTHHPVLAALSPDAPDEDTLKEAKTKAEKAKSEEEEASKRAHELGVKREIILNELKRCSNDLLNSDNIETVEEKTVEELNKLSKSVLVTKAAIKAEEKNITRRNELACLIPDKENAATTIENEIKDLDKMLTKEKTRLEGVEKEIEGFADKLEYASKEQAEVACAELETERKTILKQIEAADKALKDAETELSDCNGRVKQLNKNLASLEKLDAEKLNVQLDELTETKKSVEELIKATNTRLNNNSRALRNISDNENELNALEEEYICIKTLSNTANGAVVGKEKIDLETYVQMAFLDRITARANRRFRIMSDERFELVRCKTSDDNRKSSGLDLNVIDHGNGSEYSVRSLSGGESFEAALSLALGLSDEIQSSAGGIKLDAIFVDEGFGSLDTDSSLEKAVRALDDLANANKLVGVISHVAELKQRIDKQIVVTKEKAGGSRLEVVI